MQTDRRRFLQAGAVLAAAPLVPAGAKRAAAAPYRLSLAAYSLRKFLDLKNPTMTLEEFIGKTADWGFEGVELTEYFFKKPITPEYVMKIKRAAIKAGLPVTGTPIGNTFTLPPGEGRDKQIASMKAWIDVSADVGSPAIRIFAGSTPKGSEESQARKWAIECIEATLPHAEKRGVILALENHGGIVAKAEGMLEIVKAIKSDWFGVNLDTGNFHGADAYGELEQCAPYAVTCQIKVEVSLGGKKEAMDYPRIIAMMRKVNYRGFLTLEYEAAEDPMTAVPKHLEALRKAMG